MNVSLDERDVMVLFLTDAVLLKVLETTNCSWDPSYSSGAKLDCRSQGFRTVPVGIPSTTKML